VERPEFDVFLSYSSADQPAVEELARRLKRRGIRPWFDSWYLIPGAPWQPAILDALARSASCAVFIGPGAAGKWQNEEMDAAIDRRVSTGADSFRVIPVLLPGAQRSKGGGLPGFLGRATWVEFRARLDDEEALRRLVCGIRGVEPMWGPGAAVAEGACPYRGLQAFGVGDAGLFFGRKTLVKELLERLRPDRPDDAGPAAPAPRDGGGAERFLAIIGPSGSGKSSLARAGLVSRLQDEGWPAVICRPGADPLESLAQALATVRPLSPSALRELIRDLAADPQMLHLSATLPPGGGGPGSVGRLVVLVDQFEELFTTCADETKRQALIANLLYAATAAGGRTMVLLTLRADFYGRCAAYRELASALERRQKLVGPMSAEELRSAIEEPARLTGCEIEPGLVELLLAEVKGRPGYLPLLQHVLFQLWQQRRGRSLTVEAYRRIGSLDGALEQRAEEVYRSLPETRQQVCRKVLLRLVQPAPGGEDTRLRVALDELLPAAEVAGAPARLGEIETVIQALADSRLLTTGTAGKVGAGQRPFVELAHEALIAGWPRLREWIAGDREALLLRRELDEAASQWEARGRDPGDLYRGARLAQAEEWAEQRRGELTRREEEFMAASTAWRDEDRRRELEQAERLREVQRLRADAEHRRAEEERERAEEQGRRAEEEHRAARRLARQAFALAVLLGLTIGLAFVAWWLKGRADESRRAAIVRGVLNQIPTLLESDPTLGLLLSIEAQRRAPQAEEVHAAAEAALRRSLAASGGRPAGDSAVQLATGGPDQRFLATWGADGAVRVWDLLVADPVSQPFVLPPPAAASSPARLASPHPPDPVAALALDPRGRWLVAAVKDGGAYLRHLPPGDKPGEGVLWLAHEDWVFAAAAPFSPDGRWLATMRNGEPVLRDLDALTSSAGPGSQPSFLSLSTPMVFSRDGSWLALGGRGGTVMTLDLRAASPATAGRVLPGRVGEVAALVFSPDGNRLAGSGRGEPESVRVWTLAGGPGGRHREAPQIYDGCEGPLLKLSFSPDGGKLLGQTAMGSCLWRSSGDDPPGRPVLLPATFEAAFSPDGRLMALARRDGGVLLWDLETGQASTDRRLQEVSARTVAISPRGRWLALGGEGESAVLVELGSTDRPAIVLHGHKRPIQRVGFAADERWLIVQGTDEAPRLWDLRNGNPVAESEPAVSPYPAAVELRAAFPADAQGPRLISPGGRWLAGGRRGGGLYLWSLRDLAAPAPQLLDGLSGQVNALAFNQDDSWLAAGDTGGDAFFWPLPNPGTGTRLPVRDAGGVSALAFSPNGRWLATAAADEAAAIHLWDWERKSTAWWAPRALEQHHARVNALTFDASGSWLATGGMDRRILLWDLRGLTAWAEGEPPHETLSTEQDEVLALAFGPDRPGQPDPRWLAAVERGGTVKLWALSGSPPKASAGVVLERGLGVIPGLAFSADGRFLRAVDLGGSIWRFDLDVGHLVKLACVRAGRNLTEEEWAKYFDQEPYRATCAATLADSRERRGRGLTAR
jgi:WD40 repeat protein